MSETGQPGAATPGEHGDGTGQHDDLGRSGNGWAPPTGGWSWSAESSQETGERWRVIPPPTGWSTASPPYADLPAPPGEPVPQRSEGVNGQQVNGRYPGANEPSADWHAPVSAPPGSRDSGHHPGHERLVLPAPRPVPASEQSAPPTGLPTSAPPAGGLSAPVHAAPTSAPPMTGLPTSGPPTGLPTSAPPVSGPPISGPPMSGLPTSAPPVSGLPASGPPVSGLPTSAPPVTGLPTSSPTVQVPPVGTAASGFEMPPGLHAPTAERHREESAGPASHGWEDSNGANRWGPAEAVAAEPTDPAPTDQAGLRLPAAAEQPDWARSTPTSEWAPSWARGEGDSPGRRSRDTPAQTWAHEPSRPYEPVRAAPSRSYEPVPVQPTRPYEGFRSSGQGPEPTPGQPEQAVPSWAQSDPGVTAGQNPPGRAEQDPSGRAERDPVEHDMPGRTEQDPPVGAEQDLSGRAEPELPGRAEQTFSDRPSWAMPPTSAPMERPTWAPRAADERPVTGPTAQPPERPAWARPVSAAPAEEGLPWGAQPPSEEQGRWGTRAAQPPMEEQGPWAHGPTSAPPASGSTYREAPGAHLAAAPEATPDPWATAAARSAAELSPTADLRPTTDPMPTADLRPTSGAGPVADHRQPTDLSVHRPFRLRPVSDEPAPTRSAATPGQPDPTPVPADALTGMNAAGAGRHEQSHAANGSTNSAPYAARRSAPEPVPPVEPGGGRSPDGTAAVLPQRVPAEPDVPLVPEPPAVDPPAETPELARIATHLRRDDEPAPLRDRPEGFDVNAILDAVRGVEGVRDASLRRTPAGAHSLRLDLSDGADPAEVSRQVARLLQERMGLAAAPRGVPVTPAAPVRRRSADNRGGDGESRAGGEPRRPTNRPAGARTEGVATRTEAAPDQLRRRRPAPSPNSGRAAVEEPGATGSPATLGASYSGGQLTTTESAPSRPLDTGGRPGPRVVLDHVQVSTFGLDATVEVRLVAGEHSAAGYATGPAVDGYVLRLCAVAAAASIDELLRGAGGPVEGGRCFVEHAAVVPFGNCEVATVVALLVCDGWVEQLAGSALVAGDPRQAVVRATLAAVNRRLEALLA